MRVVANAPTSRDLKTIGVAVQRGQHGDTYHMSGSVRCAHCGGYLGAITRLAVAIGVSPSTLSAWLNARPVRPDIASKIRGAFLRVEE